MDESKQCFAALDKNIFLDELEESYNKHNPGRIRNSKEQFEFAKLSNWHEVIRDHNGSKPGIPSILPDKNRDINHSKKKSTVNKILELKKAQEIAKKKFIESTKILGPDSKLNSSDSVSTTTEMRWDLSQGWNNRPKLMKIDIALNIENAGRFGRRYEKGRLDPAVGGFGANTNIRPCAKLEEPKVIDKFQRKIEKGEDGGYNYYYDDDIGKEKKNKELEVAVNDLLKEDVAPGPRYNTRPPLDSRRKYKTKEFVDSQRYDSSKKDITFSCLDRFRVASPCSPGVLSVVPVNYDISHNSRRKALCSGGGREFCESIYYDEFNCPSPGPIYEISETHKQQSSRFIPVPGSTFASPGIIYSLLRDVQKQPRMRPKSHYVMKQKTTNSDSNLNSNNSSKNNTGEFRMNRPTSSPGINRN